MSATVEELREKLAKAYGDFLHSDWTPITSFETVLNKSNLDLPTYKREVETCLQAIQARFNKNTPNNVKFYPYHPLVQRCKEEAAEIDVILDPIPPRHPCPRPAPSTQTITL